jgi:hypothetical protein
MSFQKDRLRYIALYSKREDESLEQFRQAIQGYLQAWDNIPVVQKHRLNREVVCRISSN